jgi:hypothetical protein
MGKYPNLTLSSRPRKAKRQKEKKTPPQEVPLPPVQSDLIATDGMTPITKEMKARAVLVEEIATSPPNRIMQDPVTKLQWLE